MDIAGENTGKGEKFSLSGKIEMIYIDLYTGFESDDVITFYERSVAGEIIMQVDLWYGHFVDIISLIPLYEGMHEDSVLYNWQTLTGFYNHEEWECKRTQEFYDQLISINAHVTSDFQNAYDALKQICQSTLQNSSKLYIDYL